MLVLVVDVKFILKIIKLERNALNSRLHFRNVLGNILDG